MSTYVRYTEGFLPGDGEADRVGFGGVLHTLVVQTQVLGYHNVL